MSFTESSAISSATTTSVWAPWGIFCCCSVKRASTSKNHLCQVTFSLSVVTSSLFPDLSRFKCKDMLPTCLSEDEFTFFLYWLIRFYVASILGKSPNNRKQHKHQWRWCQGIISAAELQISLDSTPLDLQLQIFYLLCLVFHFVFWLNGNWLPSECCWNVDRWKCIDAPTSGTSASSCLEGHQRARPSRYLVSITANCKWRQ